MAWPGEIKIAAKNHQDSEHERDDPFVTLVDELAMCSKIVTKGLHANPIRISSGTSQTTNDAKKVAIILPAPVIISHNEGMIYLLKTQGALA